MAITFDSSNKRIVLDTTTVDVRDIYSRWKDWVHSGNSQYEQAFRVVGGDPLGSGLYVSSYFFLQNGWRIRPMEVDHTLTVNGNISVDGGGVPIVPTLGDNNVIVQYVVPVAAQAYDSGTGGGTGDCPTASEIAAEILSQLQGTAIPVNLVKVRGQNLTGTGTEANPWGPA